jgi:cobyric acid synthase
MMKALEASEDPDEKPKKGKDGEEAPKEPELNVADLMAKRVSNIPDFDDMEPAPEVELKAITPPKEVKIEAV